MSGSLSLPTLLASPRQAARLFSGSPAAFPKQRHVFLVRFTRAAQDPVTATLTFAVKSVDRPGFQPRTEDLNQYNKKRCVYLGWKAQPLKLQFYDTGDGAALRLWAAYSQYYFGDFVPGNEASYAHDVTEASFNDIKGQGFGFTASNGNAPGDANAQYFFTKCEIEHYYNKTFDRYTLIHPRFSTFDPDQLDYGEAAIATISAQMVFEAAFLEVNAGQGQAAGESEFAADGAQSFDGQTVDPPNSGQGAATAGGLPPNPAPVSQDPLLQQLFGGGAAPISGATLAGYNQISGTVAGYASGAGNMGQRLVQGALASTGLNGVGQSLQASASGLLASPQTYAQVNASGAATAQIGFNDDDGVGSFDPAMSVI